MIELLSTSELKFLSQEKEINEKKSSEDAQRGMYEKYSATERFEDIINTLKSIYFKLELAEKKKDHPDNEFISRLSEQRLYLADIQQRHIRSLSINMMEDAIQHKLLPELKSLQNKYPNI